MTHARHVPLISQKRDNTVTEAKAQRHVLRLVEDAPMRENGTTKPRPPIHVADQRDRKHLTEREVELLYQGAKRYGMHGARDALMIWVAYRHGLRVGELCGLRWGAHIDFDTGTIRVERLKNGIDSVQPLGKRELRGLKRVQKAQGGRYVFINRDGAPVSELGFRKTLGRIGATVPALADLMIHPHMLRHSAGYALANKGMDTRSLQHFLGHRRIENTELYTAMSATRFDKVWD